MPDWFSQNAPTTPTAPPPGPPPAAGGNWFSQNAPSASNPQQTQQPGFQPVQGRDSSLQMRPEDNYLTTAAKGVNAVGAGIGQGLLGGINGTAGLLHLPHATLQHAQTQLAADNAENPMLNTTGEALEGIAEFMSGEAALKGLSLGDKITKIAPLLKQLEKYPRIAAALHAGIRQGAVGGAQALVHGATPGDALQTGGIVGATGGAAELAIPAAVGGVKNLINKIRPGTTEIAGETAPILASQRPGGSKIGGATTANTPKIAAAQQQMGERAVRNVAQRATMDSLDRVNESRQAAARITDPSRLLSPSDNPEPYKFTIEGTPTREEGAGESTTLPARKKQIGTTVVARPEPGSTRTYVQPPRLEGNVPVNVDVKKLDTAWQHDPAYYITPRGAGGIPGRYSQFQKWLADNPNEAIQTPDVSVNDKGEVNFGDGRDRFAVLRDSGERTMTVSVPEEEAANARRLYGTTAEPPTNSRAVQKQPLFQYLTSPRPGSEPLDVKVTGGGTLETGDPATAQTALSRLNDLMESRHFGDMPEAQQSGIRSARDSLQQQLDMYHVHDAASPNFDPVDAHAAAKQVSNFGEAADQAHLPATAAYQKFDQVSDGNFSAFRNQRKTALAVMRQPGSIDAYEKAQASLKTANDGIDSIFSEHKYDVSSGDWKAANGAWRDGKVLENVHTALEKSFNTTDAPADIAASMGKPRTLRGNQLTANLNKLIHKGMPDELVTRNEVERVIGPDGLQNLYRLGDLLEKPALAQQTHFAAQAIGMHLARRGGVGATTGAIAGGIAGGPMGAFYGGAAGAAGEVAARQVLRYAAISPHVGQLLDFAVRHGVDAKVYVPLISAAMSTAMAPGPKDKQPEGQPDGGQP